MVNAIKNFYLKKAPLIIFSFGAVLSWIAWGILKTIEGDGTNAHYAAIYALLTGALIFSYFGGSINLQKMLFGSVFFAMILCYCDFYFLYTDAPMYVLISNAVVILFLVAAFICHAIQQTDKCGKSVAPLINQIIGLVVILELVIVVLGLVYGRCALSDTIFMAASILTQLMIIAMETRISEYKTIRSMCRANNTWTEEKRAEAKKLFKL